MEKPFKINSVTVPMLGSDYLADRPGWMSVDQLVSYVVGLGATDVRLVVTLATVDNLNSNTLNTSSPFVTKQTDAAILIEKFKASGLRVELAPFVPLDISQLSTGGGKPSPADPILFLTNYGHLLNSWAQFAQENQVDRFCVIQDDINHILYDRKNAEHFLPIIQSIKSVYSGFITTMIFADGTIFGSGGVLAKDGSFNNTDRASHFQLMDKRIYDAIDILGVGVFTDPITNKKNPTVDELITGMLGNSNNLNVYKFLKDVHNFYDKPIYYSDRSFHSFDGSNTNHVAIFDNTPLIVDQQEQADLFEAFFRVWSQYKEDWMLGVSFQNANRVPDYLPNIARFVDSPFGENFQGKIAESVVRDWFSGLRQGQGLEWQGTGIVDRLVGGYHDDKLIGLAENDILDGGDGTDTAVYRGLRADYTVTRNNDGSYRVTDNRANRDGTDTLTNIEQLQFSDQVFALSNDLPFPALFAANLSQGKAIAAAYQTLLGGTPGIAGFDFLIKGNLATNFGAGAGPVFNDENIFINVANSLVQGNTTAATQFNSLASGATLADKVASLYAKIIPTAKQTAEGVAFLTRPDGLKFYQDVAKERGITAENGPAVVALASLLKVAVDGKIGIGNPVSDLIASIADGSAGLPATSQVVLPIETIDGTKFDADDAPDVMPGFSGPAPAPAPIIGVADMSYAVPTF